MKIINITPLAIPEVKVLRLQRFIDSRGYFLELFRTDILTQHPELPELAGLQFMQLNESRSVPGVIRGLHTQCEPNLNKLLRVIAGKIIDVAVDIRLGSPTFGKAAAYELSYDPKADYEEIILIPFGFAHGIVAIETAQIQYFQTGVWNGKGETTIQFEDPMLDWSLCQPDLQHSIQDILSKSIFSDKDRQGLTLDQWQREPLAQNYIHSSL